MSLLDPRPERYARSLRAACALALVALTMMVWSLLDPRPMPVIVAMSIAQVLGTLSLLGLLVVVVADMRRAKWQRARATAAPEPRTPTP